MAEEKESIEQQSLSQCLCGHNREAYNKVVSIQIHQEYTVWGTFCLIMGVSAIPKKISYHCFDCKQVFDFVTYPSRQFLKENI